MRIIQFINDSLSSGKNTGLLNSIVLIAALFLTMLLSCLTPKSSSSTIIIKDYTIDDSIHYQIKNAEIINDNLAIDFEYSGTKKDEFRLLFNGKYKKSYPPIVNLYLEHKQIKSKKIKKFSKKATYNLNNIKYPNTESTIIYLYNYDDALIYKHQE